MNRIQKKCIIVSAGIHLLLALMLIFGPGFLSSNSENAPLLLKFIPGATVEALMSGGGDKSAKNPPAEATAPEAPTPTPVVVPPTPVVSPPVQVTQPPVEQVKPRQPEKEVVPVPKDPPRNNTPRIDPTPTKQPSHKPREINVDTTLVTTSAGDAKAKREAEQKAAAAAAAAERKRIAAAFGHATAGIRGGVSGSTEIKMPGLGTGGVAYGNIKSAIYTKYFEAWQVPDGAPDATVYVSITLARDGTVVTSRITDRSGNSQLDSSVQKALDRVRFVAPLPDSETQDTREFNFGFNPEMKSSG